MSDYLDASTVAAVLFDEPASDGVVAFVGESDRALLASEFMIAEVSSAISRLVRTRAVTGGEAEILLGDLDDWLAATVVTVDILSSDHADATDLVRRFDLKLRAPDALHLAICRRLDARLVTLDVVLADAATALGVDVLNPAAGG